jgi:magnesium-transporting ATPase (P-type)
MPFIGMPLPLTSLQILWINLVTDGLPGLALAVEPVFAKICIHKRMNKFTLRSKRKVDVHMEVVCDGI